MHACDLRYEGRGLFSSPLSLLILIYSTHALIIIIVWSVY